MVIVCWDDAFTDNQKNVDDLQTYSLKQKKNKSEDVWAPLT